jgi:hypothetical protein
MPAGSSGLALPDPGRIHITLTWGWAYSKRTGAHTSAVLSTSSVDEKVVIIT